MKRVRKPKSQQIHKHVPESNFETIALVMHYFAGSEQAQTVIQVGANDGQTSDSINTFIKNGNFNSYHIEPIPVTYEKLARFYSDTENAVTINAAISDDDGIATIFSVKNQGRWLDNAWASQLASFDREHLIRCGINHDEIEAVEVPSITFSTLLRKHSIHEVDILVVDVEGFDAHIVKMALNSGILPKCIYFEFVQFLHILSQDEVDSFYNLLSEHGYRWAHDRINTLALHESFVKSGNRELPPS